MSHADESQDRSVSRRALLRTGLAAAGAVSIAGLNLGGGAAIGEEVSPYAPFAMGLQSYSLRGYTKGGKPDVSKALAVTNELGLHHWEAFPAHLPSIGDADGVKVALRRFKAAGVAVNGFGVVGFGTNLDEAKRTFAFAAELGVQYMSADPALESFDMLDKLVEEYKIPIGIHNHGPGHKWAKIDVIHQHIKDHSKLIGCCIDTGHFLRSREDPVRAAEVFEGRIYGVHLKDVKHATTFTVLGAGDLKTAELLRRLAAQKYKYCLALEYEEHPENPLADLKSCLAAVRNALKQV